MNENNLKSKWTWPKSKCAESKYSYKGKIPEKMFKNSILPVQKFNITFCRVPKGASTFWTRLLTCLERDIWKPPFIFKPNDVSARPKRDNSFSVEKIYAATENTKNFMFSRNPYSRVLSFYVDKLFSPNPFFWTVVGVGITKQSRKKATCGHDVTFKEYVDYVVNTSPMKKDYHIVPINDICRPCKIKYEFIGKMENFESDINTMLEKLNVKSYPYFYKNFKEEYSADTNYDIVQAYIAFRKDADKCIDRMTGLKRIWRKLQIRGIISDKFSLPSSLTQDLNVDLQKMLDIISEVIKMSQTEDLKSQRLKYFTNAYKSVPLKTMHKLQKVYKEDLEVFGYDPFPENLFQDREESAIDVFDI